MRITPDVRLQLVTGYRVLIRKVTGAQRISCPFMFEPDAKWYASEQIEIPTVEHAVVKEMLVPDQPLQLGDTDKGSKK